MLAFWSLNTVRTYVLGSGSKLSRVSDDLIKVYSNVPTTSDKLNALVLNIHHRLGVCVQCPIHHRQLPHHPVIQSQVCVTMRPRYGLKLQALYILLIVWQMLIVLQTLNTPVMNYHDFKGGIKYCPNIEKIWIWQYYIVVFWI